MKKRIITTLLAIMLCLTQVTAVSFAEATDSGYDTYRGELPELQNAIAQEAIALAWPLGTSRSTYKRPSGSPTSAFQSAIARVYPDRGRWSAQCRAGASCDVGAGTVIRASGYDTEVSRALAKQFPHFASSSKWARVSSPSTSNVQNGDVILWNTKGPGAHICIVVEINGQKLIAEASHTAKLYLHMANNLSSQLSSGKAVYVYRATGPCRAALSEGDQSEEVKKLQVFLTWAGFYSGKNDGIFGKGMEKAVKKFQKAVGLEETGAFDGECLEKAETYVSKSAGSTAVK